MIRDVTLVYAFSPQLLLALDIPCVKAPQVNGIAGRIRILRSSFVLEVERNIFHIQRLTAKVAVVLPISMTAPQAVWTATGKFPALHRFARQVSKPVFLFAHVPLSRK